MSKTIAEPFRSARFGEIEAVRIWIESGQDVLVRSKHGGTLLHCAAERLHYNVAGLLLDAGIDPGVKDQSGYTPADWASMGNEIRMGCPSEPARQFIEWMESQTNKR
ncbi:ankyrin repeat domain-containing protein [Haloferula sp.]|uniref:ankyrin repeat domain-containing protein n=1 Tax=Haloferula sp. TaxID=2497595 RepID=UPI00329ECAC3